LVSSRRDRRAKRLPFVQFSAYGFYLIHRLAVSSYNHFVRFFATLAALLIWFAEGPLSARAALSNQPESTRFHLNSPQEGNDQAPVRTFTGTIASNGGQFVLSDSKTHKWYQLDDQNAAGKFEGKNVTVTGTLDAVKNIIRIQSIAEATA
jgi:hypothetical protein